MQSKTLPFLLALLFVLCPKSRAQDGDGSSPVQVKITRYPDHSYSAMKTDPDDHSAENSKYDSSGNLVETTVFSLDDQGRAVYGFVYTPKGTEPKGVLRYKTRYLYDAGVSSRVSEVDYYSTNDQLLRRDVYHYDAAGGVTKIDRYDSSGHVTTVTAAPSDAPGQKR
jgi:hypothetical protein